MAICPECGGSGTVQRTVVEEVVDENGPNYGADYDAGEDNSFAIFTGRLAAPYPTSHTEHITKTVSCPECGGSGEV